MENRNKFIFIPLVGALILALGIGLLAFSPGSGVLIVQAQEDEPDQPVPWQGGFGRMRGFERHGRFGLGTSFDYDTFIADALGVSVAELQDARQAAAEAALEQAVAEGVITEERAELMKARHALMEYIDKQEILASALGIDVADLESARQEGKSIAYLLGELGLDPADVHDDLQTAYDDAVQDAVADGVITEAQAEEFLENGFAGRIFGKRGTGFGSRGGFGGRGGFFGPAPETSSDSSL